MDPRISHHQTYIAFAAAKKLVEGPLLEIVPRAKKYLDETSDPSLLIFDRETSAQVEIDFRGSLTDVLARLTEHDARESGERGGPGRPRLGVISREIGLLPRHWEWLSLQKGGASVTLRKLVEEASRRDAPLLAAKQAQDACYRFMTVMAGNLPHFEEALRAFYAKNPALFETLTAAWPIDIREHSLRLAQLSFAH